jgi:CheY-like chemotaxis protein
MGSKNAPTILAVEDDEDVRFSTCSALTSLGYRVVEASTGGEALAILEARPDIHLLFTDVVMPGGMDGFELAHLAKKLRPDLRVVYTTGFMKQIPWGQHGVGYGPMLPKPYRIEALGSILDKVLRHLAHNRDRSD